MRRSHQENVDGWISIVGKFADEGSSKLHIPQKLTY